jgi:tetratricopeptide (TPR) repeat protein
VREYPTQPHGDDAYRILADRKFDANQFREAEVLYRKILEYPETPIAGYALYKIGWCDYNLHDPGRALNAFEKAIAWTKESGAVGQSLNLKREARHDLISIYAEVGDARMATTFFRRFAGEEALSWTTDLAKQLESTGQFEGANVLYAELIHARSTAEENFLYEGAILRGCYKLRHWSGVAEAARELSEHYADRARDTVQAGPAATVEAVFREAVNAEHFELEKNPKPEEVTLAAEIDQRYLSLFGTWPSAEEPSYNAARFLIRNGRFGEAVAVYSDHWERFKKTLSEPRREESLRSTLHAEEEWEGKKTGGKTVTPEAQALLGHAGEYLQAYPNTSYRRAIAYLRSAILFKYGQTAQGIEAAQAVFDENPTDTFGKRSFNNLRVAYYALKDWPATSQWAERLGENPALAAYRSDLEAIREEALFLTADEEKDDAKAAELFIKLADDPHAKRLKDKSRYNAFIRLQKLGRSHDALEVADLLEKKSPRFESLSEIAGDRAALYQEAGDYRRAAELLGFFLQKHPSDATPEGLRQASLSYAMVSEALGKNEVALKSYRKVLEDKKDSSSAQAVAATSGLRRLGDLGGRAPASLSAPPGWSELEKSARSFEGRPLPAATQKAISDWIETGAQSLTALTNRLSQLSANASYPSFYRLEAYCAIPSLYRAYVGGIWSSVKKFPPKTQDTITKNFASLDAKATAMAGDCIKNGAEACHSGPNYLRVVRGWGWGADPGETGSAERLLKALATGAPYLEPTSVNFSETEILERHLRREGNAESWYALAVERFQAKEAGLARLTLVDALGKLTKEETEKDPAVSGRLYNVLALLPDRSREARDTAALFEKAASLGSHSAFLNLAFFHLKGGRLDQARDVLSRAEAAGALQGHAEVALAWTGGGQK